MWTSPIPSRNSVEVSNKERYSNRDSFNSIDLKQVRVNISKAAQILEMRKARKAYEEAHVSV